MSTGIPLFLDVPGYPHQVLPEGVHESSEDEIEAVFVASFPASRTRHGIWRGLLRLRAEAVALGVAGVQWVDGSFVESKVDPSDVDVVTFMSAERFNAMPGAYRHAAEALLAGGLATRATHRCHTFMVLSYEPGHARHGVYESDRRYWRNWFGNAVAPDERSAARPVLHRKGLIQVVLGNVEPAAVFEGAEE